MAYRYLGRTGMRVSLLSYGNWLNSNTPEDQKTTKEAIKKCYDYGMNFFDTAEAYGMGNAELLMGKAFKELGLPREQLVVSTKMYVVGGGVNDTFLSRKHLMEGANNSLKRLGLDYVDILFCHRPDERTPLEETCRAMSDLVSQGKTHYWGTSEWPAYRIAKAIYLCEKLNLHKPVVEQPQYNMIFRERFEKEYMWLFKEEGYGTTIWSPLASGILSGKYNDGNIPEGSRFSNHELNRVWVRYFNEKTKEKTLKIL